MEDKVGSTIPSVREIEALVAEIKSIQARIEHYTVALTPEQRQSTVKFRPGGEEIVAKVGTLITEHGVTLPGITPEGMSADLLLAQRLAPLAAAAASLQQRLDDTILEAHSESWWACTAFYTALNRIAAGNATLQNSLKDVVDFFAVGRRKKTAAAAK